MSTAAADLRVDTVDTGGRTAALALSAIGVLAAGGYAVALLRSGGDPLLAAPFVATLVVVAVFIRPIVGVYVLFGCALLFEQFDISGLTPLTAQTHFYENLTSFSWIPIRLSMSDLLALTTLASWGLRRLTRSNESLRLGPLWWALGIYASAFVVGTIVGAVRGGAWDPIIALAEARGALYVGLLYFLTANLIRERAHMVGLLWMFTLLVGVKALQGIGNYAEMRALGYSLEAVTSHEDVVFFGAAVALALVMAALGLRAKLFWAVLALLPVVMVTELLTQRRSGFAVLAIVVLVVAIMAYTEHKRATLAVLAVGLVVGTLYAGAFWTSDSRLAEPLRIVRGFVDPAAVSWRDRSSDAWREIEDSNIAFTVQQLPLTGVGLGQQYLFKVEPPALTSFVYWRYIAHNAVLWLWLKGGPYCVFTFWMLIAVVVVRGMRLYRGLSDPYLRAAAALPVLLIAAQVIFSSVDLGLTYNRTMTVLGVALGLTAPLSAWAAVGAKRAGS